MPGSNRVDNQNTGADQLTLQDRDNFCKATDAIHRATMECPYVKDIFKIVKWVYDVINDSNRAENLEKAMYAFFLSCKIHRAKISLQKFQLAS